MIVQGNVLTNEGPKPIEAVKKGDIVINLWNRPCRVLKVEEENVTKVIQFMNNPHLVIGQATDIATRYGRVKGSEIQTQIVAEMLYQCEAPCFYDTLEPRALDSPLSGYELAIDSGAGVFVDGYGIYVREGKNHA